LVTVQASATGFLPFVHIEAEHWGEVLAECTGLAQTPLQASCSGYKTFDPPVSIDRVECHVFGNLVGTYSCTISI